MSDDHDRLDPEPVGDRPGDLTRFDAVARRAARGLQDHVDQHLDVEVSLSALPASGHGSVGRRIASLVAVAALLAGAVAVIGQRGDDGRVRVDLDTPLPDVEPGELSLLGPRDGKDSIQLPVTAEPSTGLHDGDAVTVTGEGFVPGESVGLVQCAREAGGDTPETRGGVDGCYITDYTSITADDAGVATGTYRVHRVLTTPLTGTVDCAAEAERCIVAMGAISDYDRSGGHAIVFATDVEPIVLPSVEVTPTEGLADGDVVHVSVSGLTPNEVLYAEVCSSDPVACWQTGAVVEVPEDQVPNAGARTIGLLTDGDGRVEADIPVWRFLPGGAPGTYVDCAVSACSLRLTGNTTPPTVPLRFDPGGEPPVATAISVDPAEGLAPGDVVLVRGTGFEPGALVGPSVCVLAPGEGDAYELGYRMCMGSTEHQAAGDGTLRFEMEVPDLGQVVDGYSCETATTVAAAGGGSTAGAAAYGGCDMGLPPGGEDVHCDGVATRCVLTVDVYGRPDDGDLEAPRPWFAPAPVPITYR